MNENIRLNIKDYQCLGCICDNDMSCFKGNQTGGVGCGKHNAGTFVSNKGKVFLGMPTGFDRLGFAEKMKPNIYETFESSDWYYNKWNVPVWKYKNEKGHTFVRGIMPRRNEPFIHIYLEDCLNKIDCLEITQADVDDMD